MTGPLLARQFELNHAVAHRNLQGISHDESLTHPRPAGNSLNWVIGHIVATRNGLMAALGEPLVWSDEESQPYARGAVPPLAAAQAKPLEDILAALDRSQSVAHGRIAALSDAELTQPFGADSTVGEWLATLSFHEAYHVGQCGLLRRLLGKDGAIA